MEDQLEDWLLEDNNLVESAKRGDIGAYETLVQRYQKMAFRTAFVLTGDIRESEDAIQEAFVKGYRALGRFRAGAPFRPWLLRIVANEARNRNRAAGRRKKLAMRVAEARLTEDDDASSPEATVLEAEERSELLGAVSELGEDDRLLIAYRYFFEMSEQEMAEALGCPRGTVKSRLSRAMGRLRERFKGEKGKRVG